MALDCKWPLSGHFVYFNCIASIGGLYFISLDAPTQGWRPPNGHCNATSFVLHLMTPSTRHQAAQPATHPTASGLSRPSVRRCDAKSPQDTNQTRARSRLSDTISGDFWRCCRQSCAILQLPSGQLGAKTQLPCWWLGCMPLPRPGALVVANCWPVVSLVRASNAKCNWPAL